MNESYNVLFKVTVENEKLTFNAKMQKRPELSFEQIEIPAGSIIPGFQNATDKPVYIAGRHEWLPFVLVFESNSNDDNSTLMIFLQKQLEKQIKGLTPSAFNFEVEVNPSERWEFSDAQIISADWCDMNYSNKSEMSTTVKFIYRHVLLWKKK